jgi:hypothetical protein
LGVGCGNLGFRDAGCGLRDAETLDSGTRIYTLETFTTRSFLSLETQRAQRKGNAEVGSVVFSVSSVALW